MFETGLQMLLLVLFLAQKTLTQETEYQTTSHVSRILQARTVTASLPAKTSPVAGRQTFFIPAESQEKPIDEPFELDLSYQKIDQSIEVPLLPGISFGCRNCTTKGKIDVRTGSFDVNAVNAVSPGDVLQNASMALWLPDGFMAYIELGINVTVAVDFEIPIIEVPVAGYTVPGVAKAGLWFEPVVDVAFTATEPVQMGFGFEVNIPKNSMLQMDFSGFDLSRRVAGFDDTQVRALPVTLNASIAGSLTTSFKPRFVFGVELEPPASSKSLQLGAEIAAELDAPALRFNLSREASLDDLRCFLSEDNLRAMVSSDVSFGLGVVAELTLPGADRQEQEAGPNSFLGRFEMPTTSIELVDQVVTATSTCVGEVKGTETQGPVVVTSAASMSAGGEAALPKQSARGDAAAPKSGLSMALMIALVAAKFTSI